MNLLIHSAVVGSCIATIFGAMLSHAQASPAASPTHRASLSYQSAFEGYRAFDEPGLASWRQANELVGRIGGWQAYAREAAGKQPHQGHHGHHRHNAGAAPAPAPSSKANLPAAAQHSIHQHHSTKP